MGVPAFFQWLRERYPTMMHEVMEGEALDKAEASAAEEGREGVQSCDNLYLDLNGIVHPCCHPEDGQPQPKSEEEMFLRVEAHLDRLLELMRPKAFVYFALDGVAPRAKMNQHRLLELMRPKAFVYFALDGVAPRAKMNQQRTRRYVAAQERSEAAAAEEELRRELRASGTEPPPPKEAKWDHNVITPGTEFMRKLAHFMRGYCAKRAKAHPRWKTLSFAISDATVPGEGEHKIISYVRALRQQEGYEPSTKHCIVGEDADLIMLSLALHEENFLVLRKRMRWEAPEADDVAAEVNHGLGAMPLGVDDNGIPDAAPHGFHLVQIDVLRGYLKESLADAALHRRVPPAEAARYHERVIDDFVFLCFFCGNDFLPHLPSFDIREGALDVIFELYRRRQSQARNLNDALLTNAGVIIPSNTASFLAALAEIEAPIFERRAKRRKREQLPKHETPCREFMQRGRCSYGDKCEFRHGDHCPAERSDGRLRARLVAFARSGDSELCLEPTLSPRDRRSAHAIADELELEHESEGAGPDRFIRLRKGAKFCQDRFPAAGGAAEATKNALSADAFLAEVKKRLAEEACKAHGADAPDSVGLGEGPGWRERYYRIKLRADDAAV
eukprot:CAMPEP_0119296272 /NCGR_PEP_ID=MMETSP1329-20130426/50488_1 /TAXON_ID=114041 /ORGANISM="Genus nov. species nov., Strain RCC1024" /LENGTH=614 /DNA_ID=CAMNT_0007297205 /DNA_START=174 /DNA_END=2015 /DNA_ORIENTATION=-